MLTWAIFFVLIAFVTGLLGFGGLAGAASGIAQLLFIGFVILAAFALLTGRGGNLLT
ncbi:MAG: hypothetical protein OHK0046_45470 [Anaerolineae bacterium]